MEPLFYLFREFPILMVVIWVILSLIGLYIFINLVAAYFSIHPIRVPLYIAPGIMDLPQERIEIKSDGLTLKGWWSEHPEPKGVIVATHGYIMNRCEWVPLLPVLHREGWSCLFVDFRGQGASAGAACTFGDRERRDVHSMLDWAKHRSPDLPLVILGSSMGAAAGVYASAERPADVDGLILDGVYNTLHQASKGWWVMVGGKTLDSMLKLVMPFGSLMTRIHPKHLSVETAIATLSPKPILLIYGTHDPIVPVPCAEKVAQMAGEGAQLEWFEGAGHGHGRFREPQRFNGLVIEFLRRVAAASQKSQDSKSEGL